jgi:hypothetical protein
MNGNPICAEPTCTQILDNPYEIKSGFCLDHMEQRNTDAKKES